MDQPTPRPRATAEAFDHKHFERLRKGRTYFLARNSEQLAAPEVKDREERTVVILGTGRNGTTMLAGALTIMGVEFGDKTDIRLGDEEIASLFVRLRRSFLYWRLLLLRRDFGALMRARTARFKRFGFKSPDLPPYLWLLGGTITNPHYIATTRNVFETSFGFSSNFEGSWRRALLAATTVQAILNLWCMVTRRPLLMVAYEQGLRTPETLVDLLIDFLALDVDEATRQRAIDYIDPTTGYQPITRLIGHIDIFDETRLEGWVSDVLNRDQPVTIQLMRDGEVVFEGTAAVSRPDVMDNDFHDTGVCGFAFTFDPPLTDPMAAELEVVAPVVGHTFWRPGKRIYP